MIFLNSLIEGSCFDLIKQLPDNSIDLVVTSPPYADVKSYGKKVNVLHPDHYVDWFLPLIVEIQRILKPSGSFILNISDRCIKQKRHPYPMELAIRSDKETRIHLYDHYIWYKLGGMLPNGGNKRLNHNTEFIFHFVKNVKLVKWNMDNVREPYDDVTLKRIKKPIKRYEVNDDGERVEKNNEKWSINDKGKIPNNLFTFRTNSSNRKWKHPAPFHTDLPDWFIEALTDEGDIVLDPFMGSGTTAISSIRKNRNWIGFELNPTYIKMASERIEEETGKMIDDFFE